MLNSPQPSQILFVAEATKPTKCIITKTLPISSHTDMPAAYLITLWTWPLTSGSMHADSLPWSIVHPWQWTGLSRRAPQLSLSIKMTFSNSQLIEDCVICSSCISTPPYSPGSSAPVTTVYWKHVFLLWTESTDWVLPFTVAHIQWSEIPSAKTVSKPETETSVFP